MFNCVDVGKRLLGVERVGRKTSISCSSCDDDDDAGDDSNDSLMMDDMERAV